MTADDVLALATQIADKAEWMRAWGSTEREALEQAAVDGLLCGDSEAFRAAWSSPTFAIAPRRGIKYDSEASAELRRESE